MYLPKARTEGIVMQDLNDEVLIYNKNTNQAFNLNQTSAIVYNSCDGKQTFDEIIDEYNLTEEIIFLALDELKRVNLLAADAVYKSPFADLSRREVIRKVGLASMIALPVVTGLIAPTAAYAASPTQACVGCDANVPTTCLDSGQYNVGCFRSNQDCNATGFSQIPTTCCSGTGTVNYGNGDGCCRVICDAVEVGPGGGGPGGGGPIPGGPD